MEGWQRRRFRSFTPTRSLRVRSFPSRCTGKQVAYLNIEATETSDSPLRKAVRFASSQNTKWPESPTKPTYAKQMLSKCTEIACDRPLKGAYPGGVLEQLALTMCDDSFTILWRSFISLVKESVSNRSPFIVVRPHKNDSLLQQKINVLNSALEALSNGGSSFSCPVCDDDMTQIDIEIRKLAAVIPTVSYSRFTDIMNAIIDFRAKINYPTFDRFKEVFSFQPQENSAMSALWDVIPSFATDAKECISHVTQWLDAMQPSEVHAQMIIILVSSEIRRIGQEQIHSAFAQKTLSKTISKATMLPELAVLYQPLDFLKASDDIASIIIQGTIGLEMLHSVTKMFPHSPDFAESLVRNGYALPKTSESKKELCETFSAQSHWRSSKAKRIVRSVIICEDENACETQRVFISTEDKKTIISTAKSQFFYV